MTNISFVMMTELKKKATLYIVSVCTILPDAEIARIKYFFATRNSQGLNNHPIHRSGLDIVKLRRMRRVRCSIKKADYKK